MITQKDVRMRIINGEYKNPLPYISAGEARKYPDKLAQRQAYQAKERELDLKFKMDALEEVGLTGHPKANAAYEYAYREGHSEGEYGILDVLEDIAELLK